MHLYRKNTLFYTLNISFLFCLFYCSSCSFELKPDPKLTYIKKNNGVVIDVVGDLPPNEKKDLKAILNGQIDRALNKQTNKGKFLGVLSIKKYISPVYDTNRVSKTKNSLFNSLVENGYYLNTINVDTLMKKKYVVVKFTVDPKKTYFVKTYDMEIVDNNITPFTIIKKTEDSIIKIGKPFSSAKGNAEINRLVTTLRNNGFYKVNPLDFRIEIDTANKFLRSTAIDFEEILKDAKAAQKFYNAPFLNAYLVQQPTNDHSIYKQYKIGNIYIYPNGNVKSEIYKIDTNGLLIFNRNSAIKIKDKIFIKNNYLKKGALFSQDDLTKTLFGLNKTDLWENIRYEPDIDTVNNIINFKFKFTPKLSKHIELGLDASRNTKNTANTYGIGGTSFWGFGLSGSYLNRNVGKEDVKSNTTLSGLIEIKGLKLEPQNYNLYLNQQFTIPKLPRFFYTLLRNKKPEDFIITNQQITANFGINNQKEFVQNATAEFSYGLLSKLKKSPFTYSLKPFNLQFFNNFNKKDSFRNYLDSNPSQVFNYLEGFGIGTQAGFSYAPNLKNKLNTLLINFNFEESGYTWGLLLKRNTDLIKFIKIDFTTIFKHITNVEKNNELAFRLNLSKGVAFNDGNSNNAMPIYKKYMSGGPSSMRAWKLRTLGPGKFSSDNKALVQVGGDMQLELNTEYRFNTNWKRFGFKWAFCGFIDIGNTFNNKSSVDFPNSNLNKETFIKSTAIGIGPGLRIDFNYVLLRFDFGYKLKDPIRNTENGFPSSLNDLSFREYKADFLDPTTRVRTKKENNYALQIGINYPF